MEPEELTNRWVLRGDPARLTEAAAALRAVPAEEIFGDRYPGEYVKAAVARLLDSIAREMRTENRLGHDVVSAATELAEHAIAYVAKTEEADHGR
jgi:hypothetical protein